MSSVSLDNHTAVSDNELSSNQTNEKDLIPPMLLDKAVLIRSIRSDLNRKEEDYESIHDTQHFEGAISGFVDNNDAEPLDIFKVQQEEATLSNNIHELTRIKTITSLIMEFKANFDFSEFENCYYSLQNLRKKIHENDDILIKNFHLKQNLITYADTLHLKLVESVYHLVSKRFWNITENSITFNKKATFGRDETEFQYEHIFPFVNALLHVENNQFDTQNNWIVEEIISIDIRNEVSSKLLDLYSNYVKLNNIINLISTELFYKHTDITYSESKCMLTFVSKESNLSVDKSLNCFKAIIDFSKNSLMFESSDILLNNIISSLKDNLSSLIKQNPHSFFESESKDMLRDIVVEMAENLASLSLRANSSWVFTKEDILKLLNDEQLQSNLLLDKLFDKSILKARSFLNDQENLLALTPISTHTGSKLVSTKDVDAPTAEADDEWNDNWGEDDDDNTENIEPGKEVDPWGEELDVGSVISGKQSKEESKKHVADDSIDNGWDEDWGDIDDDDTGSHHDKKWSTNKRNVPGDKKADEVLITKVPDFYTTLITSIKDDISKANIPLLDKDYLNYKFNFLQTTFMSMFITNMGQNWIQVYNDVSYITQISEYTEKLKELNMRFLDFQLTFKKRVILGILEKQLSILKNNDNAEVSVMKQIKQVIPFIQEEVLSTLQKLEFEKMSYFTLNILAFIYNELIIKQILNWSVISEKNSENLAQIITVIFNDTEVSELSMVKEYKDLREKFEIIGRILTLHLKDIMDMFYNGDFYLFETREIIQWINLLFADTPLRRNSIDDIKEIRSAATE